MNIEVFRKSFNVITFDTELKKGSAFRLYAVLKAVADMKTCEATVSIKKLAEKMDCHRRTVQRNLNTLIDKGLVTRILRKSPYDPKMNLASHFIVHDIDAERYAVLRNVNVEQIKQSQNCRPLVAIVPPPHGKNDAQIKDGISEDSLKENNNNATENISSRNEKTFAEKFNPESESGANTSESEDILGAKEKSTNDSQTTVNAFKNNIPDVFDETVSYLFQHTGRKKLCDSEIAILRKLSQKTELPKIKELIVRLIDESVERFTRKGRNLNSVTFCYIAKVLESRLNAKKAQTASQEKDGKAKNKAPKSRKSSVAPKNSEPEIKPELIMPVKEAEKVIADYAQGKTQTESLPTAMLELFGKIRAEHDERSEQLTLEDYLRLKFPEAEDEELRRDYYGNVHENYGDFPRAYLLEDAFKIDYACATCDDPHNCKLPIKYRQNRKNRPTVKMTASKEDGGKFLEVYCNGCIKCKHGHVGKTKEDYEFEDRVRHSGLAVRQVNQTFDAFDCQNADGEVIVAKAQAILAAKNKSNLILAGKPGTGKSHLASAIALEAMKNGHQAIFKSLPELLDEICFAYQNNNDPYGLMVKYKNVPCLVLDDWGKEKTTDARMDYLFQIIDYRYRNGLQTVLTTNAFNADGLKNRWNADKIEPLVSRILENGQWATIYASENHRLKKSPKPEAIEPNTQEDIVSSEVPVTHEAQDSQEHHGTAVAEKTPSAVVPVADFDKAENFSEP
ncbi:MAG: ATP-binding protein, partial [Synergistaceae bacterium]|nr:ATP-binding protein [Synergistaceae bacterium]